MRKTASPFYEFYMSQISFSLIIFAFYKIISCKIIIDQIQNLKIREIKSSEHFLSFFNNLVDLFLAASLFSLEFVPFRLDFGLSTNHFQV